MRSARRFAALAIATSMFALPLLSASAAPLSDPEPIDQTAFRPVPTFAPTPTPRPERPKVVAVIVDTFHYRLPTPRPRPVIDLPPVEAKSVTTVTPRSGGGGGGSGPVAGNGKVVGKASWYCNNNRARGVISACTNGYPDVGGVQRYAAAGPSLREAICGHRDSKCYRGKVVYVNGEKVTLIDYCQCYWRLPKEKVLDLYLDVFELTGGTVTVTW